MARKAPKCQLSWKEESNASPTTTTGRLKKTFTKFEYDFKKSHFAFDNFFLWQLCPRVTLTLGNFALG